MYGGRPWEYVIELRAWMEASCNSLVKVGCGENGFGIHDALENVSEDAVASLYQANPPVGLGWDVSSQIPRLSTYCLKFRP